ncbi:MAG: hypothetical protein KDD63_10305, partial [Bacteroidetes bacterium]|nr:hypothetical protein [Bacteroidota bacterium]
FNQEIIGRDSFGYPPYARLLKIEFRHKERNFIEEEALRLSNLLKSIFGSNLLGPDYALIARVRNQYRMQFMIKLGKKTSAVKLRDALHDAIDRYYQDAPVKTLRIIVDVDPV